MSSLKDGEGLRVVSRESSLDAFDLAFAHTLTEGRELGLQGAFLIPTSAEVNTQSPVMGHHLTRTFKTFKLGVSTIFTVLRARFISYF